MLYAMLDGLRSWASGPDALWRWVWLALAVVTVVLLLLMRTRWGQSRAMEKCVLLSLLTHVLLAGFATTYRLAGGPVPQEEVTGITYVDGTEETPEEPTESPRRWDSPASDAPPVPTPQPERPTPEPPLDVRPASLTTSHAPAIQPDVRLPAPMPRHERAPEEFPSPARQTAAAATIETPEEPRREPTPNMAPTASPERPSAEPVSPRASATNDPPSPQPPALATNVAPVVTDTGPPPTPPRVDEDGQLGPQRPAAATSAASQTAASRSAAGGSAMTKPADPPAEYALRTAPDRAQAAQRYGATPESEAAVKGALLWLAKHQSADGRWDVVRLEGGREPLVLGQHRDQAGIGADTGISGLAILAFLGAGHTHLKGEHRETVRKGLEFLINSQAADGNLAGSSRRFAKMYCHAMATCALSEAYVLTKDERLLPALRGAIKYCIDAQSRSTGGWRYQPHDPGDMSQHGWQVMALRSAELAGLDVPRTTRQMAAQFVDQCSLGTHRGLASYRPGEGASRSMTAEALACRHFLGMNPSAAQVREAQEYLLSELPRAETANLYYWYYATLALHQSQDEAWRRWNKSLQATLIGRQRTDGDFAGSYDPGTSCLWGGYGGRAYTTAMSALCLEVYYRFLPLHADSRETTARSR